MEQKQFWKEFRTRNRLRIFQAACHPDLPGNAMGYIAQLQQSENLNVVLDAANQIRRHLPDFALCMGEDPTTETQQH